MEVEVQEEEAKQIEYVRPLGQICRFECPANKEQHSKFLNSYQMYKYHIKYCRELRCLQEVFVCKFCVKLFLEIKKRDEHQINCSCRLVQENVIFEIPDHLKTRYPLNKITFENQEEFYQIIDKFPLQEPLSINLIDSSCLKSDFDEEGEELIKTDKSCCENSNNVFSEDLMCSDEDDSQLSELEQFSPKKYLQNYIGSNNSQQNLSLISQQIDILSVQEQLIQPSNTIMVEEEEQDYDDKKPSRKKHSLRSFKNIIKKKIEQPKAIQESAVLQQQIVSQNNQKLTHQVEQFFNNNIELPFEQQILQQKKILEIQASLVNEKITDLQNLKLIIDQKNEKESSKLECGQEEAQNQKSISSNQKSQKNYIDKDDDDSFCFLEAQECILNGIHNNQKQYDRFFKVKQHIQIKVMDVTSENQVILQQEENFIDDYNYVSYLSMKNFQKFNSYLVKNKSKLQPQDHLIASYTVNHYDSKKYLEEHLMKTPNDNQFCLMQIEITKLQDLFNTKQPHNCLFEDSSNITDSIYKSQYSIFILVLENSKIFDKDFVPQPPQNALDCTDVYMKPMQQYSFQQKQLTAQQAKIQNKSENKSQLSNDCNETIRLNLYAFEGFQVFNNDLNLHEVYLFDKLSIELLEATAIDLKILEHLKSQTQKQLFQYSNDIEIYSKQKEEKIQQLLEIKSRIEQDKRATLTKKKARIGKEKNLEELIQKKMSEKENNLLKFNQMQKEIKEMHSQVNQLRQNLQIEIDKEYQLAKEKSDQIYYQQMDKHRAEVISLASENILDLYSVIEFYKQENQLLFKEQYELMDIQRKQGQALLKYDAKYENLQNAKRNKEKLISLQKNKQQTAYLCLKCKKYPQNCLQKPCGHVVFCYSCLNEENEEKEIIFCKICKIEIIKFSEIKYKIIH
ncbi:hypothetical protein TTHERM_00522660 (macronuclear) [Tetrahymena thermophila SB210]|uniref:RING-type domain-containing protein n=2 Tax=Tetrahymena thermophila TaxID=5911 RepID=I7MIS0_TETTS|nr:hypothetical protein TTHERM_00522660 [Tetrahymena thermophila SB210]ACH72075.1 Rnf2p [Tetrahymena thermophila]EAR94199.1 hypothetical protein TTHERM_00522660 [Tetrahymena thermophila SB210]|eukprot:XP_001014444.1 hypothetical protein TTHERM_00522660 [Tetrahymena thermophila SB210]